MSTLRPLRIPVAAGLLAAVLAAPALAAPRLDMLIDAHRAEAAPTTHDLPRATPSAHPNGAYPVAEPPALARVLATAASPEAAGFLTESTDVGHYSFARA